MRPIHPRDLPQLSPRLKHDQILDFINNRLVVHADDGAEECVLTFTADEQTARSVHAEYKAAGFVCELDPSISKLRWSLYFKLQETREKQ